MMGFKEVDMTKARRAKATKTAPPPGPGTALGRGLDAIERERMAAPPLKVRGETHAGRPCAGVPGGRVHALAALLDGRRMTLRERFAEATSVFRAEL